MVYIIYLCFAVPLVLMLPLLQNQSRWLIGYMLLGATIAVSASEINSVIQVSLNLSPMQISLQTAPVTEEIMKAVPILMYAVLKSDERKKLLPLSMAVGIGFAILENTYILISNIQSISIAWALIRGFSTSLTHGMCTFLVGCGILFVKKQKKLFYTGTFGLLAVAITFHATFNLLINSKWDVWGMLLPIVVYLVSQWLIRCRMRSRAADIVVKEEHKGRES